MELTSKQIYELYREVEEIKEKLKDAGEDFIFEDSIKITEKLSDELFRCVGRQAAYEIDRKYWENK